MAGIDIQHVPYRGIAAVMPDLIAGRLTMAFGNISAVLPLVRDGKLRALAVTSTAALAVGAGAADHDRGRLPGFDSTAWFGLMAPAGTPTDDHRQDCIARACASWRGRMCASVSTISAWR